MNRRTLLIGGVAGAAVLAGAGSAWWRSRATPSDPAIEALWPMRFDTPSGGELALAGLRGKPLLLNFWATWCPPCVSEMPLLDQFHEQHRARGWQVVGLAVDSPTPVREFIAKRAIGFPIGLAGLGGTELSRTLGNSAGALPFSVVLDSTGRVAFRKLGTISPDDLARWVTTVG